MRKNKRNTEIPLFVVVIAILAVIGVCIFMQSSKEKIEVSAIAQDSYGYLQDEDFKLEAVENKEGLYEIHLPTTINEKEVFQTQKVLLENRGGGVDTTDTTQEIEIKNNKIELTEEQLKNSTLKFDVEYNVAVAVKNESGSYQKEFLSEKTDEERLEISKDAELLYNKTLTNNEQKSSSVNVQGYFPEESKLKIQGVAKEQTADIFGSAKMDAVYDIKIVGKTANINPKDYGEACTVEIKNENISAGSNVYHVKDDNTIEEVNVIESKNGSIIFEAESFSIYAITDDYGTINGASDTTSSTVAKPTIMIERKTYEYFQYAVSSDSDDTTVTCVTTSSETPEESDWEKKISGFKYVSAADVTDSKEVTYYVHAKNSVGITSKSITAYYVKTQASDETTIDVYMDATSSSSGNSRFIGHGQLVLEKTPIRVEAKLKSDYSEDDYDLVVKYGDNKIGNNSITLVKSSGTITAEATKKTTDTTPPKVKIEMEKYNEFSYSAIDDVGVTEYCISMSPTEPTSGWKEGNAGSHGITVAGTYYVYAKDAAGNVGKDSIEAYTISRKQGTGTTLTTKIMDNSIGSTSGTEFTSGTVMLEETQVYVTASVNTGYKSLVLKHGSTIMQSGTTFTVNASEEISSSATKSTTTNSYTLTLNKGTGISDVSGDGTYTSGKSVNISATVSSGYSFTGWTVDKGNEPDNPISKDTTVTITQNTTLTAKAKDTTKPMIGTISITSYNKFTCYIADNSGEVYYEINKSKIGVDNWTCKEHALNENISVSHTVNSAGTWYIHAKDAAGNETYKEINVYEITREQGAETTLTTKYQSATGTEITTTVFAIEGAEIYVEGSASEGYTLELKHGETKIESGTTFKVRASEKISSSATASTTNSYTLKLEKGNGIKMTTQLGTGTYSYGTKVSISCVVESGYSFTEWKVVKGDTPEGPTSNETTVTITQDTTLTAEAKAEDIENIEIKIKRINYNTIRFYLYNHVGTKVKYCIDESFDKPDVDKMELENTGYEMEIETTREGPICIHAIDPDNPDNYKLEVITAYVITRTQGEGTILTTIFDKSTGSEKEFTEDSIVVLEGTPIYVEGSLKKESEDKAVLLTHGGTTIKSGETFEVSKDEEIVSTIVNKGEIRTTRKDHDTFTWEVIGEVEVKEYCISKSATTPTTGWLTDTTREYDVTEEGTYYIYVKDSKDKITKGSISVYKLTRSVGAGTELITKFESSEGTEFTIDTIAIEGTPIYVEVKHYAGYQQPTIKHGSTIIASGKTFEVTTSETISSSATKEQNAGGSDTNTDTVAPTITANPSTATVSKSLGITLTTADIGGSGISWLNNYFYYLSSSEDTLADGTWKPYLPGTEFTIEQETSGTYYLFVTTIRDGSGNVSKENGTMVEISGTKYHRFGPYEFDNTPPTCTITSSEVNSITSSKEITYTIEFNEEVTDFNIEDIEVTNGTKTSFTGSGTTYTLQVSNTTSGEQTITIAEGVCTDTAGNQNESATKTITIDIDGPEITKVEGNATEWTKENVTLEITATDAIAGLNDTPYSFDGGETWQVENTKTYTENTSGIQIKVRDALENIATYEGTIEINKIDTEAPSIISVEGNPTEWTKENVTLVIKAEDTLSGLHEMPYSFDGGETWQAENTKTYIENTSGIQIQVRDALENIATYEGTIEINKILVLESIAIKSNPDKVNYKVGEKLDTTGLTLELKYNSGSTEEITSGFTCTPENGATLDIAETKEITVTYEGKTTLFNVYVTEEKLEITIDSNVYAIGSAYIKRIQPSTTFTNLKNNINTTSKTIEVKDKNGNVLGATDIVATGMTLILDGDKTYTLVVVGDVNGDGQANLFDILSINKHRLNKTQLTGEYLLAGDVIENSKVDLFDLLQINKFRLRKISQL